MDKMQITCNTSLFKENYTLVMCKRMQFELEEIDKTYKWKNKTKQGFFIYMVE
jgi:hypothetical protein